MSDNTPETPDFTGFIMSDITHFYVRIRSDMSEFCGVYSSDMHKMFDLTYSDFTP